jgi:sulfoxide reductase heme-binding subunit YedZ
MRHDWLRGLVIAASTLPMVRLVLWPMAGLAGANPVEFVTRSSGTWALVFLLLALAVSPLRKITGMAWLMRLRRPLGLASFGYALAHLVTWVWLEHWFELAPMITDIFKRPFITAGFVALVLLVPLAVTSTDTMMRRLGRRWGALHRLVYVAAVLAVLHYWWHKAGKADVIEPAMYALVLAVLLGWRIAARWRRMRA